MDSVKYLIDKLSQYQLATNILPGMVLCAMLQYVVGYDILTSDKIYIQGIIVYFVGVMNNRFGSIVIEPLLKSIKLLDKAKYDEFVKAELKNEKVRILNMEGNAFRSYSATMALTLIAMLFKYLTNLLECPVVYQYIIAIFLLLFLFIASYIKQTKYVKDRVEAVNMMS